MTVNTESQYRMTLSLNVLNHLGINLYSNVHAVLSEVVANAWDADAENVSIIIDEQQAEIAITDDGHGMNIADANDKFLMVGYQRREMGGAITEHFLRPVMGRKGIGKLSLFSIAKTIRVYSVKDREQHGFKMILNDIKKQIEGGDGTYYYPQPLSDFPNDLQKGTRIIISDFKRNFRQPEQNLRRRLARRFSVIGSNHHFGININGKPISIADRDYFHKIQFLWTYNDNNAEIKGYCKNLKESEPRVFVFGEQEYEVSGWIGTVDEAGSLKDSGTTDNLNKIVVMVRGKVAQEDMLDEFSEGGMYSKYIFGELQADFLDTDADDDIATSSRQQILEDDQRYLALKDFVRSELKYIQSKWTDLRNDEGTQKALEIPAINEWYKNLGKDIKKRAKSLFGKINKLTIDSDSERRSLLKHGILAFESLRVKENLDALDRLDGSELEEFVRIFQDIDDIEATLYRQIVMSRVEVIRSLQEKVDQNVREKILQKHLYDHLWLLDPGWERTETSEYMEQQVDKEFGKIDAKLSKAEKKGRVDIKYRTTSGKHLIIELKRASRIVSSFDLMRQSDKYRKALSKILKNINRGDEPIDTICVLGKPPSDWENNPKNRDEAVAAMEKMHIRVVLYSELIESAGRSYQAYLDKQKEAGRIFELIQRIDQPDE